MANIGKIIQPFIYFSNEGCEQFFKISKNIIIKK